MPSYTPRPFPAAQFLGSTRFHFAPSEYARGALRVLDRLTDFRGDSRFLTWALAVATRVALSELRKGRYKDVPLDALAATVGGVAEPAVGGDPGAALDRAAVHDALRRLIGTPLTDRQRSSGPS